MFHKIYLIFYLLIASLNARPCIVELDNREIVRNNYTIHETIQSENFVIHFTTADIDSQEVFGVWYNLQSNYGYAQSIIDHMESAYSKYLSTGWEQIPPDCDESIENEDSALHCKYFGGNALYDIYIANDAAGMVVPETPYPVEPYIGGYTSFMKISTLLNEYTELPSWSYHVIAHELHHAIQMRYGYSVSGSPGNYMYNGWFFEQTASYMENVIYPNNIHLSTMLSNCNVTTPLTYPEYNIDHSSELYQYRSALWQKYLVESFIDSSIIRILWENYGIEYATGNPVSLFPIYNDAIKLVSNNKKDLSDGFQEYAKWRYFTGSRAIDDYFSEAQIYCEASLLELTSNSISFASEKGASRFIQLGPDDTQIHISTLFSSLIQLQHVTSSGIISNFELNNTNSLINIENLYDEPHALLLTTRYTGSPTTEIELDIFLDALIGDLNNDGIINILDVILLVNLILSGEYSSNADINEDGIINILDVVIYRNIIIGN